MIKGLIFDMDGTLIQNMPYHMKAFDVQAERHGFKLTQPVSNKFYGWHNHDIYPNVVEPWVIEKFGVAFLSDEKEDIYRELYAGHVALTQGLDALLEDAAKHGVKCYIGSAGPKVNVDFIWREAKLDGRVDGYICGDDVTNCKPHPEIFLKSCERMGLKPEECVVFEDAVSGIKAGFAAQCKVVGLDTTAPASDLEAVGVKNIVHNFEGVTIESLEEMFG